MTRRGSSPRAGNGPPSIARRSSPLDVDRTGRSPMLSRYSHACAAARCATESKSVTCENHPFGDDDVRHPTEPGNHLIRVVKRHAGRERERQIDPERDRSEATRLTLCIATAENNSDMLAGRGPVAAREQRGEGRRAARLDDETEIIPEHVLRADDLVVFDEEYAIDMLLRDREHQLADAARRQRISRDAARRRIDRMAGLQRFGE